MSFRYEIDFWRAWEDSMGMLNPNVFPKSCVFLLFVPSIGHFGALRKIPGTKLTFARAQECLANLQENRALARWGEGDWNLHYADASGAQVASLSPLQGYLAHKKQPPTRTLQKAHA